jgi:hypothetical protein
LLLEAIVTLCLFGLFSLFIFQKQIQQRKELEEISIAEGIKAVQEATGKYVNDHWMALTKGGTINGVGIPAIPPGGDVIPIAIDDAELANFLPADFDQANTFNGAFRIAIKRKPDAKKPIQAVVVSGNATKNGSRLDDMSGVRIAAMVGSGGGVIRSDGMEAKGTMGLWKLDGPTLAAMFANPEDLEPVRVVATSDFALDELENPLWKSVLFRENRSDFPDGNTMLTDIDMAGEKDPATGKWKNNNIVNLNALRRKLPDGTTEDVFTVDNDTGLVTFKKNVKIEGRLTGAEAEFSGNVKVGSLTSAGAVSGTTGTFTGAVSGTMGSFSGNVSGAAGTFSGVITSNASATPGAACGGGQVAKSGTSTMICDKGKWIMAGELAKGDMCMTCYFFDGNNNNYNLLNCARFDAINYYGGYYYNISTFRSVYDAYKNSMGECSFKANSVPVGWVQIGSGEYHYVFPTGGGVTCNDNACRSATYDNNYYYINVYMKLL